MTRPTAGTAARTLSLAECAAAYGRPRDWFYRHWRHLVEKDGMPDALNSVGRPRFPRARYFAWVEGVLIKAAANDPLPATTVAEHRAELAREYGRALTAHSTPAPPPR